MVLPVIIVGGLVAGGVTGYGMYHLGEAVAVPSSMKEAPPKSALSITAGGGSALAAYSLQGRLLRQNLSHLMMYEVPTKVESWKFQDFLRVVGPFTATRVLMFGTSLAVMGFVSTKIDVVKNKV